LLPRIRERAERAESERRIPAESIQELLDAGLFNVVTPKQFGGAELGIGTMVEVAAALGSACGSTGWVYGVLTGHAWMAALFTREAQKEVFADPRALTASVFRLNATVVPAPGGYRLTQGSGRFCSGVDYSRWVIVGVQIAREGAAPEGAFMLVPMQDVEIVDDWHTAGLRGTGSRSIRIDDTFVPEHRVARAAELMQGKSPGSQVNSGSPIYALPFPIAQPFSLVGTVLGLARGALGDLTQSQAKRFSEMPAEWAAEQGALFARLARVAVEIDAAETRILRDAARFDSVAASKEFAALERAGFLMDLAHSAQTCRYAVTRLFEAGGGSGIYNSSALQRMWRDVNAATPHVAFNWDQAATQFGRAQLGIGPGRFAGPPRKA
jgi:alkylation response protein AidB-like acyl-CoA dehydrogenase